ncbi:M23 family metallopeptidase [Streptomyces sp. NPDC004647]|uniref:M23 family metallopeptidase n=1 Tax=Streptomyces sp. NPDC004647 TaxID=3154671 RepID=UPI0033AB1026
MSKGAGIAAGAAAAVCGVILLPLILGTGGMKDGAAWEDSCTAATSADQAADEQRNAAPPSTAGGKVSVPLNPQGRQKSRKWTQEQTRWASVITSVARSRGLAPRGAVIGVATAIQESMLDNINYGDRDSLGLFQQRPSQGWGTRAQVTDPVYASNTFYSRLAKRPKWEKRPLTVVAQEVQRSGYPTAYAKWEKAAGELVAKSWGKGAVLTTTSGCDRTGNVAHTSRTGAWALPVEDSHISTPYKAGGSAWSSGYHTGVDFPVPVGTRVQAVGTGTVVEAGWGSAYGNNIVIRMSDGKYTHYAHLAKISVARGQKVTAHKQIGLSGNTGNSSGPHLHFEARTGPAYGSDFSPLAYLRSHGLNP